jgi:hypothetical protein
VLRSQRKERQAGQSSLKPQHAIYRWTCTAWASQRSTRAWSSVVVVVLMAVAISACGSAAQGPTVVAVGQTAIGKTTVDHLADVLVRGGTFDGAPEGASGTPRQRTLAFLISAAWLREEAAREGLTVSGHSVAHALAERKEANGGAEFDESLHATGETVADVELEIEAELASKAIGQRLDQRAAEITPPEIVAFYKRNSRLFRDPEERVVELVENLPSKAAATALLMRIGTGRRFATMAYHEILKRTAGFESGSPDKEQVVHAIFAARLGVASEPMRLNGAWTVFVVRKVTPARLKPLASVQQKVKGRLTAIRRRKILAIFDREYTKRWTALTSCRPAYVVQGCKQYHGPVAPSGDSFSSG